MQSQRAFIAGASGAVGRVLCSLLLADGWKIFGMTRSAQRAETLRALGALPLLVDVYDAELLRQRVTQSRPDVIIHQLTDLPFGLDPALMPAARVRNTRIRIEGTRNLLSAALAAGTSRFIAQSLAFAYAPGAMPYRESSALDASAIGVIGLEQQVLQAPLDGIVLRYGRFYGPGTGTPLPTGAAALHVQAAADAARRAVTRARAGIYNIAEDDGIVDCSKAIRELGWSPGFRESHSEPGG